MSDTRPLDFYCAFHLHQPVGNFGHVIEDHVRTVYRPLIDHLAARPEWPVIVHVSGALLEWCERHERALIDDLAQLAADGRAEFLLAGFYEPVLASLPVPDRIEQIQWLREWLQTNIGASGDGLWLTERVWEPDLARDLADAGIRYALVDDRHFLVSGHEREALAAVFRTEHDGRMLDLLPIDETLRYLIPFRPVSEIQSHLRAERDAGRRVAIFADDAEKFGGWPKTHEWVFGSGWLDEFLDTLGDMHGRGEIRLVRGPELLRDAPRGGLAYLGNASYREMEQWSLPPELGRRHAALSRELGEARIAGVDGAFIRGAHWKHFLVKYPEANRAHKHMLALSRLCRERGNPAEARRAIGRGQSNDSLWHGVFGGLYLPWLREAVWRNLADAERQLRRGQALEVQVGDHDADGEDEWWIHGAHTSVIIAPHRGGGIELWLLLDRGENGADALTRRIESYHHLAVEMHREMLLQGADDHAHAAEGAPSIHAIEHANTLAALPPADLDVRSLCQVRIVDGSITEETWQSASYLPVRSYAMTPMSAVLGATEGKVVEVQLSAPDLASVIRVHEDGALTIDYNWSSLGFPVDAQCLIELSLAPRVQVDASCEQARLSWRAPIESVAKSERGLERTVQGQSIAFLVPVAIQHAHVSLRPAPIAVTT
jgi:alpha-amylase